MDRAAQFSLDHSRCVEARHIGAVKEQLLARGWATVQMVTSPEGLLSIAQEFGSPLRAPTGEFVKVLTPRDQTDAPRASLSARYGKDSFPFHTDTAFWPTPCRFIVMRVVGDRRRFTHLLDLDVLMKELGAQTRKDAEESVWRTFSRGSGFYCSLRFRLGGHSGWRFDPMIMQPANSSAVRINELMAEVLIDKHQDTSVSWEQTEVLIVDNWRCLHRRGAAPPNERRRELLRVYVG